MKREFVPVIGFAPSPYLGKPRSRIRMKIPAIVSAWILSLANASAGELLPFLESIANQKVVEIHYTSTGCFHHFQYFLKLKPLDPDETAVEVIPMGEEPDTVVPDAATKGVVVRLTHNDVRRLSALFEYYDSKPSDNMCTTVDKIRFGQHLADASLPSITITDASCDTRERLDILTFGEIIQRAELSKKSP